VTDKNHEYHPKSQCVSPPTARLHQSALFQHVERISKSPTARIKEQGKTSEETTGRKRPASDPTSCHMIISITNNMYFKSEVLISVNTEKDTTSIDPVIELRLQTRCLRFSIIINKTYSFCSTYSCSYNSERKSIHMAYNEGSNLEVLRTSLRITRLGNRLYHMPL
jgi:hypothetical protein